MLRDDGPEAEFTELHVKHERKCQDTVCRYAHVHQKISPCVSWAERVGDGRQWEGSPASGTSTRAGP